MFEDGNPIVFIRNAQFFWLEFFFSSLEEPGRVKSSGEDDDVIKKFIIIFFLSWYSWNDYAYIGIIMHLLNLVLL